MKFSKAMVCGIAFMTVFSISAATIAARSTAPDFTYYSDATYSQVVGETVYGCNGGHTTWGTVTSYYTVEYIQCY